MAANSYSWLFLVICATVLLLSSSPTADAGALGMEMTWMPSMEDEFQLDNEINRRILATTKYISYGALQRNTVPCSRRGASYYNCQPGAQANPYSRGCSAITRRCFYNVVLL
ncbi:Protein RALF-like 33, partial [Mucuna pruriens]